MSPEPEQTETAWCAGFTLSGRRELVPAELTELSALAARLGRQARLTAALGPGIFLLLLALAGIYALTGKVPNWLVVLLALGLPFAPLGFFLARDAFLRARALREDVREGSVRQFTGTVDPAAGPDETRDRLVRRRLLTPDPRIRQGLELLPHSQLIWTVNGRRTYGWIAARSNVVAQVPEYAAMAAQWVEPARHPGSEGMHINFRDLSAAERAELQRHWKKLLFRPLGSALLLTIWAATALSMGISQGSGFGTMMVGAIAVWSWLGVFRMLKIAGTVRRDAAAGRVVIVRRAQAPGQELSPAEEYLPQSGIPWSAGERPAPWRIRVGK